MSNQLKNASLLLKILDKIQASFNDGVLKITLPKLDKREETRRKIHIQ